MVTLVIPDIHNRTENADYWLQTQRYDRVVFLGDYFDCLNDTPHLARKTALWVREQMKRPDAVFLLGNHDVAYMFPKSPTLTCTGFTHEKSKSIRSVLGPEHWSRFQLAHFEQGWLLSHAGIHPFWIKEVSSKWILARCNKALKKAKKHGMDPMLGVGHDRGGLQQFGGPLWIDWDTFEPVAGINQIVGHTSGLEVRKKITDNSKNYCIDVRHASAAALLCDGWHRILVRE